MLPKEYAEAMRSQYPDSLPQLERAELERALQALKLYLTDARTRVQMQLKTLTAQQAKLGADKKDKAAAAAALVSSDSETSDSARPCRDGAESREFLGRSAPLAPDGPLASQLKRVNDELKQTKALATIVDTTLLKCYLQVCARTLLAVYCTCMYVYCSCTRIHDVIHFMHMA